LLADLDGNGFWDADEVKALFQKELDKMYDPNAPEDDMRERREEMERMREHVYSESDVNKDHLIRQIIILFRFLEQFNNFIHITAMKNSCNRLRRKNLSRTKVGRVLMTKSCTLTRNIWSSRGRDRKKYRS
jgi:hypothetical protein